MTFRTNVLGSNVARQVSPDCAATWEDVKEALARLPYQWEIGYDPGGCGEFKIFRWREDQDRPDDIRTNFNNLDELPLAVALAALLAIAEAT